MKMNLSSLADLVAPGGNLMRDPNPPMLVLFLLAVLGAVWCLLLMLTRLYRAKGALHVVLGIVSLGLYPFIWGWTAPAEFRVRKVTVAWTLLAIVALGLVLSRPKPQPRPRPYPRPIPESTPPWATPPARPD